MFPPAPQMWFSTKPPASEAKSQAVGNSTISKYSSNSFPFVPKSNSSVLDLDFLGSLDHHYHLGIPTSKRQMGKTASLFFFSINTSGKALPCQSLEPGNVLVGLMRRLGISSNTRSQIGDVKERVQRKWQNAAPPVTSCVPSHAALSHLCLLLILFPAFGMLSSPSLARWLQTCKVSNPDALCGSLHSEFAGLLVLALRQ